MIFFIITIAGAVAYLMMNKDSSIGEALTSDAQLAAAGVSLVLDGLPDVSPNDQSGGYSGDYDDSFLNASQKHGVPFALLKAHAIRESNLSANASRTEPAAHGRPVSASYGLMQILWWPNSGRFQQFGMSDDTIGDGSILYNPTVNTDIAAQLILQNFGRFKNLRDTVNAYNTGTAEKTRVAPGNYTDDVLKYYGDIVGQTIT